jgi:hypothetical protein
MSAAFAQDAHLERDPSSALYTSSPFAHGFRHGYEAGYHDADAQLQLSRFDLASITIEKVPKPKGYEDSFGSKDRFNRGFQTGYKAGFGDSAANRPFRLHRVLNAQMTDPDFDAGVEAGAMFSASCQPAKSAAYCTGVRVGRELAGRTDLSGEQVAAAQPHPAGRD